MRLINLTMQLVGKEKINFIDIQNNLERILNDHKPCYDLTLEGILEANRLAREEAYKVALANS